MTWPDTTGTAPVWTLYGVLAATVLLMSVAFWAGRHRRPAPARPADAAGKGISRGDLAAAAIATAVSADGMWTTFADLHMAVPLRAATFAFLEVAVWQSARRAQRSMRENYAAGVDGVAMWVLTCVSAVLSASHEITQQHPNPAIVLVRLVAPLVAAWGWERSMRLERRRRRGLGSGVTWRFTLDRIAVKLGLAEVGERGVDEVDAHRRLAKVARAADRARTLKTAGARPGRQVRALARAKKAWAEADEYAKLSNRPELRQALLELVGGLYNVEGFVGMQASPWWGDAAPATDLEPEPEPEPVQPPRASDKLMRKLRLRRASEEAMRAAARPALDPAELQPPTDAEAGAPVTLPERTRPAEAVHLLLPAHAPAADAAETPDAHPPQVSAASECASAPTPNEAPAPASGDVGAHLAHVDRARDAFADDLAAGRVPSLRRIQAELRVGQRRAQQVQSELRSRAS